MLNKVLAGLVYQICVLYTDDVLIHGRDLETFLHNVRRVFERLREFNVAVNPAKTKLGLAEVERGTCNFSHGNIFHGGKAVESSEVSVTRDAEKTVTIYRFGQLFSGSCA